jgi:hypothetical protein
VGSFVPNTKALAVPKQDSTAVFDFDGKLKLPTAYHRYIFPLQRNAAQDSSSRASQ